MILSPDIETVLYVLDQTSYKIMKIVQHILLQSHVQSSYPCQTQTPSVAVKVKLYKDNCAMYVHRASLPRANSNLFF